jgi:hypothetical protein
VVVLRLLDVLWGAALWVFVTGEDRADDDRPISADLAAALGALIAVRDEQLLDDDRSAARISPWLERSP